MWCFGKSPSPRGREAELDTKLHPHEALQILEFTWLSLGFLICEIRTVPAPSDVLTTT